MTLQQLEVFLAVADVGSFTRAGEKIGLSQSGVSHTIASLEEELGTALFSRSRNGVKLTEAGEQIYRHAKEIMNRVEAIKQEAAAAAGLQTGTLRIGSFPSVSAKLLPGLIRLFRQRYPGIELVLFEGSYQEIAQWIASGVIDVAFIPRELQEIEIPPLYLDPLVVVMPPDHWLSGESRLQVQQLSQEPFIMPKAGCEILVEQLFRNQDVIPEIQFEVADTATIVSMVQEGLGITIVPQLTLPHPLPDLVILPLEPPVYREIGLAVRGVPSPAASVFMREAQEWIRQWQAGSPL